MTLTRTLPLAALAAVLAAQPAGAQVTTSTPQDTSRASTQPVTTSGHDMNATTNNAAATTVTTPPTTTNQSNMAGQNNLNTTTSQGDVNASNGMSAGSGSMSPPATSATLSGTCATTNNPDCSSGLVRPGGNVNGDMSDTGRTRMRVGKDHMDMNSSGTGTAGTGTTPPAPTTPL